MKLIFERCKGDVREGALIVLGWHFWANQLGGDCGIVILNLYIGVEWYEW